MKVVDNHICLRFFVAKLRLSEQKIKNKCVFFLIFFKVGCFGNENFIKYHVKVNMEIIYVKEVVKVSEA